MSNHGSEVKADAYLEKGELDGKVVWFAVIRAIEELKDMTPPDASIKRN